MPNKKGVTGDFVPATPTTFSSRLQETHKPLNDGSSQGLERFVVITMEPDS